MCLISLGRFINYGAKICWDRQGAYLKMFGGESCELYMHNNCPYVSLDIVKKFEKLKETEYKNRRLNVSTACSAMDLAMPQAAMVKINEKPWKTGKVLEEWPTSRPTKTRSTIEEETSRIEAVNFDAKFRSYPRFKGVKYNSGGVCKQIYDSYGCV